MNTSQARVGREIARVRLSLRTLDQALRRLTPVITTNLKTSVNGTTKPTMPVSARTRAARVLQGRYMGFVRQLKPRQKTQVRKVRKAKGVRSAIVKARTLASA